MPFTYGRQSNPRTEQIKEQLHRHIIDQLDDEPVNLLEGSRVQLKRFVAANIQSFIRQHQLGISGFEVDRLTEEMLDELTSYNFV